MRSSSADSTTYLACPTDIVEAPIDIVWSLLTNPADWGSFYDIRVLRVEPPGPMKPGQRLIGETGTRWLRLPVSFEYKLIDELQHKLEFDGQLPFGMTVHESMDCIPIGSERCRVNYHCNFALPSRWKGTLLRRLLGGGFESGPADSLRRLKLAAEGKYAAHKGA
jgi:hypothetical protein